MLPHSESLGSGMALRSLIPGVTRKLWWRHKDVTWKL